VILFIVSAPCAWFGFSFMLLGGLAATAAKPNPTGAVMFLIGLAALVAAPAMWLYSVVNAYRTAERINHRQLTTY
jgi:hypothetical protein